MVPYCSKWHFRFPSYKDQKPWFLSRSCWVHNVEILSWIQLFLTTSSTTILVQASITFSPASVPALVHAFLFCSQHRGRVILLRCTNLLLKVWQFLQQRLKSLLWSLRPYTIWPLVTSLMSLCFLCIVATVVPLLFVQSAGPACATGPLYINDLDTCLVHILISFMFLFKQHFPTEASSYPA